MPDYHTILFDLDGTLTDPSEEMIVSAAYALEHFNIHNFTDKQREDILNIPLLHCFEESFGLTQAQADQAFQHYWYYANAFGPALCKPYPGVPELLDELKQKGCTLGLATARKTENAQKILKVNKLDGFFNHVFGVSDDDNRRTKKMVIFDLLMELGDEDPHGTIMVGDRPVDITGGKANGLDTLGVTFGQDTPEAIQKATPTFTAHTPAEMVAMLLTHT